MKTKKLNKRLVIKRETISDLDALDMNTAKGGGSDYWWLTELSECPFDCWEQLIPFPKQGLLSFHSKERIQFEKGAGQKE